ncbi:MAG TPA: hypothetical protein VFA43_12280 [Gemmatimonadaceae bacterium]|nr:hypothetical protein [Gemmatimonadaceae bacterium]
MTKKIVLLALVVGCSSSTTAPHTGSLKVTVDAPAGLDTVTIAGPGGFTKKITSSTTLAVAPGSYTVAATDIASKDSIVGIVYDAVVTGSPATIAVGATATVSVGFAVRPGSGAMWVVGASASAPNTANGAIAYTVAQLRASSSARPTVHLAFPVTPGGNIDANDVAIDGQGNLWVANENSNTAVEYGVSALSASGSPTPVVTLQQPASSLTTSLAFDANGDLWVANGLGNAIVEFTPSQLTSSGSPTPAVTITSELPEAIRFDSHGNLWALNSTDGLLYGYTPGQLAASGQPVPSVTLSFDTIPALYSMAFDASGNLWLTALASLVELSSSSLATSGTPTPAVTLTLPNADSYIIASIAFDNGGDLWYSDIFHATIAELVPSQLAATAKVTPTVALAYGATPLFYGTAIAFSPHTPALPLH